MQAPERKLTSIKWWVSFYAVIALTTNDLVLVGHEVFRALRRAVLGPEILGTAVKRAASGRSPHSAQMTAAS